MKMLYQIIKPLDVLSAQRIMVFYLNYPEINEVRKSDHMDSIQASLGQILNVLVSPSIIRFSIGSDP